MARATRGPMTVETRSPVECLKGEQIMNNADTRESSLKFLSLACAAVLLVTTQAQAGVTSVSDGLVGYWSFDNITGATVPDGSPYGNNGTIIDGVTTTPGVRGGTALDFAGGYVEVPDSVSLNPTDPPDALTITAWFKFRDPSNMWPPLVKKASQAQGVSYGYALEMHRDPWHTGQAAVWSLLERPGQSTAATEMYPVEPNKWYFCASVYDGKNFTLYVGDEHNAPVATTPISSPGTVAYSTFALNIGRDPHLTDRYFNGLIDEVAVYKKPLSSAQVQAIWTQPKPHYYGIFVGSNDYKADGTVKVNGQLDAEKVYVEFSQLVTFSDVKFFYYNVANTSSKPTEAITAALDAYTNRLQPGDNLIFFYSGHGGGSTTDPAAEESLYVTKTAISGQFVDDDLTAWFLDGSRKDKWAGINKMFVLDSCFSGGFWNGENQDLNSLQKVALLAAAGELQYAEADPDHNGEGFFSRALEDGLSKVGNWAKSDVNKDGLITAEELKLWLENYALPVNAVGYIKQDWPDDLVPVEWQVVGSMSGDFDMVVPEPATLSLLALGGLAVLLRKRR